MAKHATRSRTKSTTKPARVPINQRSEAERAEIRAKQENGGFNSGDKSSAADGTQERRQFRRAMKRAAGKILFFIDGNAPTVEEFNEAQAIGNCVFRNARKIVPGAPLENCDAVAGAVPDDYAAFYPEATENHEIDEREQPEDMVNRPARTHPGTSGNGPDDQRPGTVDDGIAHASGTGSAMPGVQGGTPASEMKPGEDGMPSQTAEQKAAAAAWKTDKVGGV